MGGLYVLGHGSANGGPVVVQRLRFGENLQPREWTGVHLEANLAQTCTDVQHNVLHVEPAAASSTVDGEWVTIVLKCR